MAHLGSPGKRAVKRVSDSVFMNMYSFIQLCCMTVFESDDWREHHHLQSTQPKLN